MTAGIIAPVIRRVGPPDRWLEPSGDPAGAAKRTFFDGHSGTIHNERSDDSCSSLYTE